MCHRNLGTSPLWGVFLLCELFRGEVHPATDNKKTKRNPSPPAAVYMFYDLQMQKMQVRVSTLPFPPLEEGLRSQTHLVIV